MGAFSTKAILVCSVSLSGAIFSGQSIAQERKFSVEAKPANKAIPEFARQAGVQIVAPGMKLRGIRTNKVNGQYDTRAALRMLLRGYDIRVVADDGATITLASAQAIGRSANAVARPSAMVVQVQASDAQTPAAEADTIVVTGTRQSGMAVDKSPTPVQVVGAQRLTSVGQPDLNLALNQIVPSYTAEQSRGALTSLGKLRGLSPNHALVLVNGKRRHPSADFHFSAGPFQGGFGADLSLIPPAAVARIEVLTDGAAAQYGSDAVAGVINIILKSDRSGGSLSLTGGQTYDYGGDTAGAVGRLAVPLGDNGFINATASYTYLDHAVFAAVDRRVSFLDRSPIPGVALAGYPLTEADNYPGLNPVVANSRGRAATAIVNVGYDFGGVELYASGTIARKRSRSIQNYRLPTVVSRPNDGRPIPAGSAIVNGIVYPYPYGFVPIIDQEDEDYAVSGGVKGEQEGWRWDLSATYGRSKFTRQTVDSANFSLFRDFGTTPENFYTGGNSSTQLTLNLDIVKEIAIGLAKPMNLAFGAERRRDTYSIAAGEPLSYYKTGSQGAPGFQPSSAGTNSRKSWAGYIDVTVYPLESWLISAAGRHERYNDLGSTTIGKLTTRYDFSDTFAVRATGSTGFRAPSLGESFYRVISVSPTSETVVLPADSDSARLLGYQGLRPEKSKNLSLGIVTKPLPQVTLTLDAYQINVRNRVASTGTIPGLIGFQIVNQSVLDAIALSGRVFDTTVPQVSISTFTNAFDTRTRGADLVVSTMTDFGSSRIDWSLNATYNKTKVTDVNLPSSAFSPAARSFIENASPRYKVGLSGLLTSGDFTVNLRETVYGPAYIFATPNNVNFYKAKVGSAAITDLELGYKMSNWMKVAVGANNLFNKQPDRIPVVPGSTANNPALIDAGQVYGARFNFAAYGQNGGYYYVRLTADF